MILRFFLRILYFILKQVVLLGQVVYFPFTVFKGKAYTQFKGPGIIVSNHPNTLLDPFNVVSRFSRQSFFLANAGIFQNPIAGFLLRHLYCIPIHRPGIDKSSQKVDNEKSFAAVYQHLEKDGIIYIAPEGGSYVGWRLRPLKTGTARIALGMEARHNFSTGLCIYPVGVNYEHPFYCGSRLYLEAGKPIQVAAWKEAYEKDPKQAARDLTDHIAERTRALIIDTINEEQEQLLYRLERILQHDIPLAVDQHYERKQRLLSGIRNLSTNKPAEHQALQVNTEAYRKKLKEAKLTDRGLSQRNKHLWTIPAILGWPIWLYGRINNIFAYEIPRWIERKMGLYIGYRSTVKMVSGSIVFPLFYFLQYKLVQLFTDTTTALWYLLSLPLSGILAWAYAYHVQPRLEAWQWRKWARHYPTQAAKLLADRSQLAQTAHSLLLVNNKSGTTPDGVKRF